LFLMVKTVEAGQPTHGRGLTGIGWLKTPIIGTFGRCAMVYRL